MRVLLPCALAASAATSMQLSRIGFFIFNCKDALIRYAGFKKKDAKRITICYSNTSSMPNSSISESSAWQGLKSSGTSNFASGE